jgi:DNA-binding Xre family transcriptional regulator
MAHALTSLINNWTNINQDSLSAYHNKIKNSNLLPPKWQYQTTGHLIMAKDTVGAVTEAPTGARATKRDVYTKTGEKSQLNQALDQYCKSDAQCINELKSTCWLCGMPIYTKISNSKPKISCREGYPEAEHVLPLKYAHKLLSVPGEIIDGTGASKNKKKNDQTYNLQIGLELRNSHRLCNQIKNQRMFIEFNNNIWKIKEQLLYNYLVKLSNLMSKLNKSGSVTDGNTDVMGTVINPNVSINLLTKICTHLNTENGDRIEYILNRWTNKWASKDASDQRKENALRKVRIKYGIPEQGNNSLTSEISGENTAQNNVDNNAIDNMVILIEQRTAQKAPGNTCEGEDRDEDIVGTDVANVEDDTPDLVTEENQATPSTSGAVGPPPTSFAFGTPGGNINPDSNDENPFLPMPAGPDWWDPALRLLPEGLGDGPIPPVGDA